MFFAEGTIIDGKFQLRGTLGQGGMGVVYEALQVGLDRIVALKLLSGVPEESKEEAARFEREGLILSKLSHVNIVQFYAYGTWQALPYIVMERLLGDSLQKMLVRNEPLPLADTIEYALQICDGLEHAHAHGVFHRDIKPTNILICTSPSGSEVVKIIDFGLAKLTGIDIQQLTQTNAAVGSVLYMSPEQCSGNPADRRSDIYSLGCLLYHCLTGNPPFVADNAVAVMFQQVNEPVQNTFGWQRLPGALQAVLACCMRKEPSERFQSCAELRDSLSQAAQSETISIGMSSPNSEVLPLTQTNNFPDNTRRAPRKSLLVVITSMAGCVLVAGTAWLTMLQLPSQREKSGAMGSLSSPKEIVSTMVQHHERSGAGGAGSAHFSQAELKQFSQALEQLRHDPLADANAMLRAYSILDEHYQLAGDAEMRRSFLSKALEVSEHATDSFGCVNVMTRYRDACLACGRDPSLLQKLEAIKQRFPGMNRPERFIVDLELGNNYAKVGRFDEARQLFLSVGKNADGPDQLQASRTHLKQLDDKCKSNRAN